MCQRPDYTVRTFFKNLSERIPKEDGLLEVKVIDPYSFKLSQLFDFRMYYYIVENNEHEGVRMSLYQHGKHVNSLDYTFNQMRKKNDFFSTLTALNGVCK